MIKIKGDIDFETYYRVVYLEEEIEIDPEVKSLLSEKRKIVEEIANSEKVVYGLNTGFGKLANVKVTGEDAVELQYNLIRSHSAGTGSPVDYNIVRGIIFLRIVSFLKGISGISYYNLERLVELLNKKVYIFIPEKGSVGASGDLAPLAHIILAGIGEGEVIIDGKRVSSKEYFEKEKLKYFKLSYKEGLALINGTNYMTARLMDAYFKFKILLKFADITAMLTLENLKGKLEPFYQEPHLYRKYKGQINTAKNFIKFLKDSKFIGKTTDVQDPYSLRCIPQIHGAIKEVFKDVENKLQIEINSVTDNPLIFNKNLIISQGNFHGEILAFYSDFLCIAATELGAISERRLERLLNPLLSRGFPAFLAGKAGLHSGLMIVQYSASALVMENRTLSTPASVQSISVSANQEDFVSNGANAVIKLSEVIENLYYIISAELLANILAKNINKKENNMTNYSSFSKFIYEEIEKIIDINSEDHPFYKDIEIISKKVINKEFLDLIEKKFDKIL